MKHMQQITAKITIVFIFFSSLSLSMPKSICAQEKPSRMQLAKLGAMLLQNGEFEKALGVGAQIASMAPSEPEGYRIIVIALWNLRQFPELIYEIERAKKNGVRDLFLMLEQAKALYFMGGFMAALQTMDQIETYYSDQRQLKFGNLP
jgi:hypothetical protein